MSWITTEYYNFSIKKLSLLVICISILLTADMLYVCIMKASSHIINFDSFNNYPIILLLLSANLCHQRLINESTIHADYRHKKSLQILLSLSIMDILLAAIPAESGSAGTSTNPAKCFHPNLFPTCSV